MVTNSYTWFSHSVSACGRLTPGQTQELGPGDGSKWRAANDRGRQVQSESITQSPSAGSGNSPQPSRAMSFWRQVVVEWWRYNRKASRITKEYEKLQTEQCSPQSNWPGTKEAFPFLLSGEVGNKYWNSNRCRSENTEVHLPSVTCFKFKVRSDLALLKSQAHSPRLKGILNEQTCHSSEFSRDNEGKVKICGI